MTETYTYDAPLPHVFLDTILPSKSHKFTEKERDGETGNDNFGARYYANNLGRFSSVDPIVLSPQKIVDPQQFNMYSYARNNPLRFIDPNGEIVRLADLTEDERNSLIAELEKDTGLTLRYNSDTGDLDVVGDPTKATGGSATFRQDLLEAIGSKDTYNVVDDPKAAIGNYDSNTKTAHIDFSFFSKKRDGFTLGLTFYHELIGHGLRGYGDPETADDSAAALERMRGHSALQLERKVADELGLPTRADYHVYKRDGKYFVRMMEPLSEYRNRGFWSNLVVPRRTWDVEITEAAKKKDQ